MTFQHFLQTLQLRMMTLMWRCSAGCCLRLAMQAPQPMNYLKVRGLQQLAAHCCSEDYAVYIDKRAKDATRLSMQAILCHTSSLSPQTQDVLVMRCVYNIVFQSSSTSLGGVMLWELKAQ